ncbi:MAG TPA: molybdopterin dinucleotide binding domain-containing protein, partial [Candidatus Thalassarchaeaceae archaeon]|nr:molybdopterin dinucleotide binding domain-containing protein [Candidatus Thalassarchaeaceae archaeon]
AGHPGTSVMHSEQFSRGLGYFAAPEYSEPNERPSDEFPFILVTGRNIYHYNSGTQTRRTGLAKFRDSDYLEMNYEDANSLSISNGDEVWISSPRNRIKMIAQVGNSMRKGNLFTTFHFPDIGINSVLSSSADGYTFCPEYKVQAVSVERV